MSMPNREFNIDSTVDSAAGNPWDLFPGPDLLEKVSKIRALLFDMDGVLYKGDEILPGVLDCLAFFEKSERSILFVTNNATRTPAMFVDKLAAMGIAAREEQVLTSADATGGWMARNAPSGSKVQLIGQAGVWSAMLAHGFRPANKPQEADFVVVGMDFHLDYRKCAEATLAIRSGARFIATNEDSTFPSEEGEIPGAGAIVALLKAATGVEPEVIGKPHPGMFEEAMNRLQLNAGACLMVGDRYETDIQGAQDLSMWTVGVCTGVTSHNEFLGQERPPNFIFADVQELTDAFRQIDGLKLGTSISE